MEVLSHKLKQIWQMTSVGGVFACQQISTEQQKNFKITRAAATYGQCFHLFSGVLVIIKEQLHLEKDN